MFKKDWKAALCRAAVVATILLSGCATKWEKPGGTEAEFDSTLSHCKAGAFAQFPPMMSHIQTSAGYTTPMYTNCYPSGFGANCVTTGGQYMPPTFVDIDQNGGNRSQAVDACLLENGWTPQK